MEREKRIKQRIEATNNLEKLFSENCRKCPEGVKNHTTNEVCQTCPILVLIQTEGKKIGGIRYNLTEEDYKAAEQNGINRSILKTRIVTYDWDIERAVTDPVLKKKRG